MRARKFQLTPAESDAAFYTLGFWVGEGIKEVSSQSNYHLMHGQHHVQIRKVSSKTIDANPSSTQARWQRHAQYQFL